MKFNTCELCRKHVVLTYMSFCIFLVVLQSEDFNVDKFPMTWVANYVVSHDLEFKNKSFGTKGHSQGCLCKKKAEGQKINDNNDGDDNSN